MVRVGSYRCCTRSFNHQLRDGDTAIIIIKSIFATKEDIEHVLAVIKEELIHPLPEHVYDVSIQFWKGVALTSTGQERYSQ